MEIPAEVLVEAVAEVLAEVFIELAGKTELEAWAEIR